MAYVLKQDNSKKRLVGGIVCSLILISAAIFLIYFGFYYEKPFTESKYLCLGMAHIFIFVIGLWNLLQENQWGYI